MSLKFEIDVDQLAQELGSVAQQIKDEITEQVENLSIVAYSKVVEMARDDIGGSLGIKYMDNVKYMNPEKGLWVITLKEPAMFIEEGTEGGFQSGLLTGKSSKMAKDGHRYAIVPFEHSKAPTQQGPKAREVSAQLKEEFTKRKIKWAKIEKDENGSPRLGLIHRFDVNSPRKPEKEKYLQGVSVYQTKRADGTVRKDIMTYRVISDKHKAEGKWIAPAMEAEHLFEKVLEYSERYWETQILPEILKK